MEGWEGKDEACERRVGGRAGRGGDWWKWETKDTKWQKRSSNFYGGEFCFTASEGNRRPWKYQRSSYVLRPLGSKRKLATLCDKRNITLLPVSGSLFSSKFSIRSCGVAILPVRLGDLENIIWIFVGIPIRVSNRKRDNLLLVSRSPFLIAKIIIDIFSRQFEQFFSTQWRSNVVGVLHKISMLYLVQAQWSLFFSMRDPNLDPRISKTRSIDGIIITSIGRIIR